MRLALSAVWPAQAGTSAGLAPAAAFLATNVSAPAGGLTPTGGAPSLALGDPQPGASMPPAPPTAAASAGLGQLPALSGLTSAASALRFPFPSLRLAQAAQSQAEFAADQERFLNFDGLQRRYLVHLPTGYDPAKSYPVVLVFHGGGGRAESVRAQSGMDQVADRYGFIAVYPDGTGPFGMLTWNAGSGSGYAMRHHVDDVGFVRDLIQDDLPLHYSVDPRRVYATGISNGAMLCYRLACELPGLIAAIGPVAGGMGVTGPVPASPVPVIDFHGMQDPNYPFYGGIGPNAFDKVPRTSIPDTIAWWVQADHCQPQPDQVVQATDYVETRYDPAAGAAGAPVVLYALPDGGHTWPGGVNTTAWLGTGNLVHSVDASTLMWQFFSQFALPQRAG